MPKYKPYTIIRNIIFTLNIDIICSIEVLYVYRRDDNLKNVKRCSV